MKPIEEDIIRTINRHSTELLEENWKGISEMLKETPDGKASVGLAVGIDWSQTAPKVKTVISYSRKWKDEREDELDDPNQPRLSFAVGRNAPQEASSEVGDTHTTMTGPGALVEPPGDEGPPADPGLVDAVAARPKRGCRPKTKKD